MFVGRGERQSVLRRERGLGAARQPLVRILDAAAEREVAEHSPDDAEHEHEREEDEHDLERAAPRPSAGFERG